MSTEVVALITAKSPAKAPKSPTKGAKKTTPKKMTSDEKKAKYHPTYQAMIKAAVKGLDEDKGSSRAAILKYILANFNVGNNIDAVNTHLRAALKAGVANQSLKQSKGTGAAGSFRLGKRSASPKKVKKPAAKKVAKGSLKKSTPAKVVKKTKSVKKVAVSEVAPVVAPAAPVSPVVKPVNKTKVAKKSASPKKAVKSPKTKKTITKKSPKKVAKKAVSPKKTAKKSVSPKKAVKA